MRRASQLWALAVLVGSAPAGLVGCSETVELPSTQISVGAFPAAVPPSSDALLTVSVRRDCASALGGVCTVCGSLVPIDRPAGTDDGALYDPGNPIGGAGRTVRVTTKGGEFDLVYRSPASPGARVVSFLLFDNQVDCDGSAASVAAASVRIDVSAGGDSSASPDAGSDEPPAGGDR